MHACMHACMPSKVDPACGKKHLPNESGSTATGWLQDLFHIVTIGLNEGGVVEVFAISSPVLARVSIWTFYHPLSAYISP